MTNSDFMDMENCHRKLTNVICVIHGPVQAGSKNSLSFSNHYNTKDFFWIKGQTGRGVTSALRGQTDLKTKLFENVIFSGSPPSDVLFLLCFNSVIYRVSWKQPVSAANCCYELALLADGQKEEEVYRFGDRNQAQLPLWTPWQRWRDLDGMEMAKKRKR